MPNLELLQTVAGGRRNFGLARLNDAEEQRRFNDLVADLLSLERRGYIARVITQVNHMGGGPGAMYKAVVMPPGVTEEGLAVLARAGRLNR